MKLILRSTLSIVFRSTLFRRTLSHLAQQENCRKQDKFTRKSILFGTLAVGFLGYYFLGDKKLEKYADAAENMKKSPIGQWRPDLPTFTQEDVGKHSTKKTRIWVAFREGVYDITDYIAEHPGGKLIEFAGGKNLDFFFRLYGLHELEYILARLEKLRIGNLHKKDQVKIGDFEDPYASDPSRHSDHEALCTKPYCGGVNLRVLADKFVTPNEYFFVRSHLPVPQIDPNTYEFHLEVDGTNKRMKFTLDDIKRLPKVTITCTLMCTGNRRSEMLRVVNREGAVNWGPNAMGTAKWTGVRLRDLLKMVGITEEEHLYKHVQFEGWDLEANGTRFGTSIPIWKAVDEYGDVILAYEMNGVPLPPDHGFPLRLIVPGTAGARSVKWVARVLVSKDESPGHYQQIDYKAFAPSTTWKNVDYQSAPAVQTLPVTSAICRPSEGELVDIQNGCVNIKGYSYSGGGQKILRVDVTIDGGKTWHVANLDHQDSASPPRHWANWAWTLWSAKIPIGKDQTEVEIWCKAVDSSFNTQPETFENIFNFKGVLSNAYHRVKIKLNK